MQAFSGLAFGKQTIIDPWLSVGILAASMLISFGLAIFLFSWDSQNSTRRGHPLLALLALAPYIAGMLLAV
jgi:hypothetical protein